MEVKQILGVAATSLACAAGAHALTITPAGALEQFTGPQTAVLTATDFSNIIGPGAIDLFVQPVGGGASGDYANSYTADFIPAINPTGANISLVGGESPISGFSGLYLYVKDGDLGDPAWYLFNISSWNGLDPLELDSFWGGRGGSITHIGIIGTGSTSVPDGGTTMILLGAGLSVVAAVRRKLSL